MTSRDTLENEALRVKHSAEAAGDELHALCDHVFACVFNEKMDGVRRDHIVDNKKSEAFLGFEKPT